MPITKSAANTEYFASISPEEPDKLAAAIQEKITIWRRWAASRGIIDLWTLKLKAYYGVSDAGNTSQRVTAGGTEGELDLIKVNDMRTLIQEQLVTVTGQRPAGIARAINSDTRSLKAAKLGSALSEYYMTDAKYDFEGQFVRCAEMCFALDEGWANFEWDKTAGDPIAVDENGEPVMSGDAYMTIHPGWNVARDPGCPLEDQSWHIITCPVNKFDLAAKYPRFHDQIVTSTDSDNLPSIQMNNMPDGTDMIWVHYLIHDRSPSVKSGRYSLLIGDTIVLDTDLPYENYPVLRMTASEVIEGSLGYAPINDVMGPEQITDSLWTIVAHNLIKYGGINLIGPEGSGLAISNVSKFSRFFEVPANMVDMIKTLDLCKMSPLVFEGITALQNKKDRAMGSVSNTLTAQAQKGASGSSMALIQTMAVSYNSGGQRSYYKTLSNGMTILIGILRTYADSPRIARIVGKIKAQGLKEWKYTGEDLNSISSISYEVVNPMMQTYGGRLSIAQDLLKAGMIKSPKQYINLVTTGQTEVLTQDDESDQMLILEENEALSDEALRPVEALITDNHADHIRSHLSLLTQESREQYRNYLNMMQQIQSGMMAMQPMMPPEQQDQNPIVQKVLDHIQSHINFWMEASMQNPAILIATGQQPLPMPMMPPPPGAEGAPEVPPETQGGGTMTPAGREADQIKEPNIPHLPNVPNTKEKPQIPGLSIV